MSPVKLNVNTISSQLLFTTIRIETTKPQGIGSGTGFIYQIPAEGDKSIPVLVTNKHVVQEATQIRFFFHESDSEKKEPIIGNRLDVAVDIDPENDNWIFKHPNPDVDIAIAPIAFLLNKMSDDGKHPYYKAIPPELIPDEAALQEIDAIESIIMIGYPNGIYDSKNLMPIVRTGAIATPVQLEYEGLPVFMIDASVFPGSSGSPVFLFNPSQHHLASGGVVIGSRIFLLGVVASVHVQKKASGVKEIPTSVQYVESEEAIDLGVVFKSECIQQAVDLMIKERGI